MSRAIRENRFVCAFLGLGREIQSSEGSGQVNQNHVAWKQREIPPRACMGLGHSWASIPWTKGNTQRGKTCNPSGKLLAMSFLLENQSWTHPPEAKGRRDGATAPELLRVHLTHLHGLGWDCSATGGFPEPTSHLHHLSEVQKGRKVFSMK